MTTQPASLCSCNAEITKRDVGHWSKLLESFFWWWWGRGHECMCGQYAYKRVGVLVCACAFWGLKKTSGPIHQVISVLFCFICLFWDRVSHWFGTRQESQAGWPMSLRHPPVSTPQHLNYKCMPSCPTWLSFLLIFECFILNVLHLPPPPNLPWSTNSPIPYLPNLLSFF